jgi:hypothetical protein
MPDITPFLKLGATGIALFALVLALIILYRVINAWVEGLGKKNGNGSSGSRPVEYWELVFARIVKEQLNEHEQKVRKPASEEAALIRQEMLEAMKKLERQLALGIVEITRQIRDR